MKKFFIIVFIALFGFVLTGCNKDKKITCTYGDYKVEIVYKGDIVKKFLSTTVYEYKREELAKQAEENIKNSNPNAKTKLDGKKLTVTTEEELFGEDEEVNKDDLKSSLESVGYTCN